MRYLWRFASPSTLLFALLLFPLPWVEIQCPSKQSPPAGSIQAKLPAWMVQPFYQKHDPVLAQSGLQAVYGGWRHSDPSWPKNPDQVRDRDALNAAMSTAPALALWPGLLVGGIVVGCLMPVGWRQRTIIGMCAATALLIAMYHRLAGFPLEDAYRSVMVEEIDREAQKRGDPPPTPQEIRTEMKEWTRYTAWFWLAQYATALSLAMLAAEWWWFRNPSGEPVAAVRCLDPSTQTAATATL